MLEKVRIDELKKVLDRAGIEPDAEQVIYYSGYCEHQQEQCIVERTSLISGPEGLDLSSRPRLFLGAAIASQMNLILLIASATMRSKIQPRVQR